MLIAARRLYDQLYDPWRVGGGTRSDDTPPGEIIGRGGDIYVGAATQTKCYAQSVI